MDEGGGNRREDEQEPSLEPAGEARHLDQEPGEDRDRRLHEHVTVRDVDELVRQDALELRGLR